MNFGVNKCAVLDITKGKPTDRKVIDLLFKNIQILALQPEQSYKYLGFNQSLCKSNSLIKAQIESKVMHRIRRILSSELNSKNKFKAMNTWSIPLATYSFGFVDWTDTDLEALNRQIRTNLIKY